MRRVCLDTCCVIYLLEDVPGFSAPMRAHLASNADAILCVSPLVRLEALVKPLVDGNQTPERDYEDFLVAQQWLHSCPTTVRRLAAVPRRPRTRRYLVTPRHSQH